MELCLGTVQFGLDYGIWGAKKQPYQAVAKTLDYAILHGIYFFDTAAAYGSSERVLGQYVRQSGYAGRMKFISKLPPDAFDGKPKDGLAAVACSMASKSRDTLGVSRQYGYIFHNASYIYAKEAVEALYAVKKAGICEHIGVSVYTPKEAIKALEYDEIEIIQIPYNVFDRRLDQAGFFLNAQKKGIRVFARSTLLQGLLLMKPEELPDNMRFAKNDLRRFQKICEEHGISALEAAVGYVKRHGGIDYMVFGVDYPQQIEEYISVYAREIPEDIYQELSERFRNVKERLVNPAMWNE